MTSSWDPQKVQIQNNNNFPESKDLICDILQCLNWNISVCVCVCVWLIHFSLIVTKKVRTQNNKRHFNTPREWWTFWAFTRRIHIQFVERISSFKVVGWLAGRLAGDEFNESHFQLFVFRVWVCMCSWLCVSRCFPHSALKWTRNETAVTFLLCGCFYNWPLCELLSIGT